MKITKSQLKQIIKEELESVLREFSPDDPVLNRQIVVGTKNMRSFCGNQTELTSHRVASKQEIDSWTNGGDPPKDLAEFSGLFLFKSNVKGKVRWVSCPSSEIGVKGDSGEVWAAGRKPSAAGKRLQRWLRARHGTTPTSRRRERLSGGRPLQEGHGGEGSMDTKSLQEIKIPPKLIAMLRAGGPAAQRASTTLRSMGVPFNKIKNLMKPRSAAASVKLDPIVAASQVETNLLKLLQKLKDSTYMRNVAEGEKTIAQINKLLKNSNQPDHQGILTTINAGFGHAVATANPRGLKYLDRVIDNTKEGIIGLQRATGRRLMAQDAKNRQAGLDASLTFQQSLK